MNHYFKIFDKKLTLTSTQQQDAKTKYSNICKTLHNYYYTQKYNGSTKFLFGSYKKKINIRPMNKMQDVDVLFKIPKEIFEKFDKYESNGQSSLLQEIRNILNKTFTTTDKICGWGKVVLVKTIDGTHNIEVLPAYELEDKIFKIPNSENDGKWEIFDPREDINKFQDSNKQVDGLVKIVTKMLKSWKRQNSTLDIKSYQIEQYVIEYFDKNSLEEINIKMFIKIFNFLKLKVNSESKSFIETAINRLELADKLNQNERYEDTTNKLKLIFGDIFPSYSSNIKVALENHNEGTTPDEQYIDEFFEVDLFNDYDFKLDCEFMQDGFQKNKLVHFLKKIKILKKNLKLTFSFITDIPKPYKVYWKVRNFGEEARKTNNLRGQIIKGLHTKTETTLYKATHYVECYIIKDNICIAIDKIDVPIGDM